MSATNSWYALKNVSAPTDSVETGNTQGETLTIQVLGDASAFELQVYGQVDLLSHEWIALNAINLTTLDIGTSLTKKAAYMVSVDGIAKIQFRLRSVSGGTVSVFCRITKGG